MRFFRNSKNKKYRYHYGIIRKRNTPKAIRFASLTFIALSIVFISSANHLFNDSGSSLKTGMLSGAGYLQIPNFDLFKKVTDPTAANFVPDSSRLSHNNITSTVFWVGEPADSDNGYIANNQSAWDGQWQAHYGGVDDPAHRLGYYPAGFTPKENPFYVALPYNDISSQSNRKNNAASCLPYTSKQQDNYSWCKNIWVLVRHGNKAVYAQWEDVGPYEEDDYSYVFGNSAPKNTQGAAAGIDVSPAVKNYLGLQDVDKVDWTLTAPQSIPAGPWRQIVTSSKGESLN